MAGSRQKLLCHQSASSICLPLRVESNGSFRFNKLLASGQLAQLMIGTPLTCQDAAEKAARQSLAMLNPHEPSHPSRSLIFFDTTWPLLLEPYSYLDLVGIRKALGDSIPSLGAASLNQTVQPNISASPWLLNQNIQVILIGE